MDVMTVDPQMVLGNKFLTRDGKTVTFDEAFAGVTHIGVLFSAAWCPPCRAFGPLLEETYNAINQGGKKLAVVFVSSDRSEDEFRSNFAHKHSEFLAIPYGDPQAGSLKRAFNITGIPSFVVITKSGKAYREGRRDIMMLKEDAFSRWAA